MTTLQTLLAEHVETGSLPGAVALVSRGEDVEEACAGVQDLESRTPMTRDSIFRLASITKPIVAAAVLTVVDEGRIALDDPVAEWLPELAEPRVVRTPDSPVDDVVPANRPITVFDLLTSRCGYGFPSDFSLPAVQPIMALQADGREVQRPPAPDAWLTALAEIPLLHQPGAAWLYNTSSDLQGVLLARVCGKALPEVLQERIFGPLGMADTGFVVPAEDRNRMTGYYKRSGGGELELADAPDGWFARMPAFPSGAGGLAGTLDDWLAFARMLVTGGAPVLTPQSLRRMTTDHLTEDQRKDAGLFVEGQGWGFGGSVDVERIDVWNSPGRYGWVGGTGTSAHVDPATGTIAILLTQVAMDSPVAPTVMREFWSYAAGA